MNINTNIHYTYVHIGNRACYFVYDHIQYIHIYIQYIHSQFEKRVQVRF